EFSNQRVGAPTFLLSSHTGSDRPSDERILAVPEGPPCTALRVSADSDEFTTNDRWDYQHASLETATGMTQSGLLANATSTETSGSTVTSLREVFTVHMPL
ncbi:hypothetical protein FOZ63_008508, partial [Perkinsus olseni]